MVSRGFRDLSCDKKKPHLFVELLFENEEKLDFWCEQKLHEALVSKIQPFFVQNPFVSIEKV